MNIQEILRTIRNKFIPQEQLSNETVVGFLRVLESLEDEHITCDELFVKLDEYVEREVDGNDAAQLMPLVRDHLNVCQDCFEEYEALLDVLEKTSEEK